MRSHLAAPAGRFELGRSWLRSRSSPTHLLRSPSETFTTGSTEEHRGFNTGTSCPAILIDFLRGEFFMFEDLKGRTAVVFGVANQRSIAWAIAQGLHAAGANLAITYQNERMEMEAKDLILS